MTLQILISSRSSNISNSSWYVKQTINSWVELSSLGWQKSRRCKLNYKRWRRKLRNSSFTIYLITDKEKVISHDRFVNYHVRQKKIEKQKSEEEKEKKTEDRKTERKKLNEKTEEIKTGERKNRRKKIRKKQKVRKKKQKNEKTERKTKRKKKKKQKEKTKER